MRRVAVTGMGIISCLGNSTDEVLDSLKAGRSGLHFTPEAAEMGLRSHVSGCVDLDLDSLIDRRQRRFQGDSAGYAFLAMQQAIEDAGLEERSVVNPRTGIIAGSGGASCKNIVWGADTLRERGVKRLGPFLVPKTMGSTVSACLATAFQIKGINYSITSACATSTHCIGAAMEQIQMGKQDVIFAGGGEEGDWSLTMMFDAMGALSTKYNDAPELASRAYDVNRDGFVIASGGGMLVLEEWEHARRRGARIYAELVGYGANSDGADMVAPSGEGAERCMHQAINGLQTPIDYINTHGTSTPVGDVAELQAIRSVFGDRIPPLSSSKSLCGHSLGATGVQEAIHCLLMMQHGFVLGSANIDELDPKAEGFPIVRETHDAELNNVLSNNFGFGGTNACLVFRKV